MSKRPTVLMILDGYGLNDRTEGNAIKMAKTPIMDLLYEKYPNAKGYASGLDVGLPKGQMGNSGLSASLHESDGTAFDEIRADSRKTGVYQYSSPAT